METLKAIVKRKSTRAFLPEKQIPKTDLEKILAAGCAAPVGMGDYGSLHLTVIKKPEALAAITKVVQETLEMDKDVLYGAPVFVIVSTSKKQKALNIHFANAACVAENMLIAATDMGIDSLYLWGAAHVIAGNDELCRQFNIPDGFKPVSGVALGYAVEKYSAEKKFGITLSINYV